MKTRHFITCVTFLAIAFIQTSCVHYYYAPSANSVPLFKEKNEARINAQQSAGNNYAGFDIQTAYAINNHTAVQLNVFHGGENDNEYGHGNGTYVEAAGGYFKPSSNKHWIFESYAGIGFGGVTNVYGEVYNSAEEKAKTSVSKVFVQPSFGYSSAYFDVALSSKFSLVHFGIRSSSLSKENNSFEYEDLAALNNTSHFFWEPGLMLRGGFRSIKIILQVTKIINDKNLPVDNINASLGLFVPFKIKPRK